MCQTQFLEGRSRAEFSSNPATTETFFYRLGLVLDSLVFGLGLVSDLVIGLAKCSSWSRPSPAIYAFFSLSKQNHLSGSLFRQMGNVIAIGLTPSRTGIVIGRLLNAQLRHMSALGSECARCGGINNLYFGHRQLSASCIIQFGFTKFVGVFPLIFLRF